MKNKLENLFSFVAIAIGSLSGIPWIKVGVLVGEKFHSPILGNIVSMSVVLSFGVTTVWVFFEIQKKIKSSFQASKDGGRLSKLLEHSLCFFFGFLATIVTIYISYKYNKNIFMCILASTVAFSYATFGIYNIKKFIIYPILNRKYFNESHSQGFFEKKITLLICLFFPLIDFSYQSIAIYQIAVKITSIKIAYLFLLLVTATPMYGLNTLSAFSLATGIIKIYKGGGKIFYRGNFLLFAFLLVSFFSSCTNGYVVYSLMYSVAPKWTSIVITISILLSQTALQTLALTKVSGWIANKFHYRGLSLLYGYKL